MKTEEISKGLYVDIEPNAEHQITIDQNDGFVNISFEELEKIYKVSKQALKAN